MVLLGQNHSYWHVIGSQVLNSIRHICGSIFFMSKGFSYLQLSFLKRSQRLADSHDNKMQWQTRRMRKLSVSTKNENANYKIHVVPIKCPQIHNFCRYLITKCYFLTCNGPLTRYVKVRVAHAPGKPRTISPPPRVSDPDMHHGTRVTHVSCCMSGSLTSGFLWNRGGETVPGIPGAWAKHNFTYLARGPWFCRCSADLEGDPARAYTGHQFPRRALYHCPNEILHSSVRMSSNCIHRRTMLLTHNILCTILVRIISMG